ncbi:group 1 truncated hemoglobin [Colwelliaceae bacterium 6441]
MQTLRIAYLILCLITLLAGCSTPQKAQTHETLFHALGKQEGLEKLVDAFIQQIGKDKSIHRYFAKASVSHFRKGFINHLCSISDGPCQYNGDSMQDIHTGMKINEADFNRVVELLINAMENADIAYPVQNKVLAKLAPLRGEIIKI